MSEIALNRDQYLELEKIGLGAFQPLDGFMREDEFRSVVDDMRLPGGAVFPLPVVLDVDRAAAQRIRGRARVALTYEGCEVGWLAPDSFYTCDRAATARAVYGTDDPRHPGVAHFLSLAEIFVGGKIGLTARATFEISAHELTPAQTREHFARRGWRTVVGFQTRNVPHRAHEYLLRVALEHADGLFVQPLVGRKKVGDYTPQAILAGYGALVGGFLPADRVLLGILSTAMRYAGPREAVFHAIIRRNYGCTHFIVGRDHAGVGDWYGKYDAHELTRRFDGELGIQVMRLAGPYYCSCCDGIVTEKTCVHLHTPAARQISGTDMRAILVGGKRPDPNLMRVQVIDALDGIPLFITKDS